MHSSLANREGPDLGIFGGTTQKEDMGETAQVQTTILLTTHRRKVFLDKGVPQKQAKS